MEHLSQPYLKDMLTLHRTSIDVQGSDFAFPLSSVLFIFVRSSL